MFNKPGEIIRLTKPEKTDAKKTYGYNGKSQQPEVELNNLQYHNRVSFHNDLVFSKWYVFFKFPIK